MGQWQVERVGGRKKGEMRKSRRGEGQGLPPPTPALESLSRPESPVMPPVSAQEGENEDRSLRRRRALRTGLRQRETRRDEWSRGKGRE